MCLNQKEQGKCCVHGGAETMFEYFRETLNRKRMELDPNIKFKVVKTACLGQCAIGPNLLISPDNVWYNYSSYQDIDEIIDVHLIQKKIVKHLINKGMHADDEDTTA